MRLTDFIDEHREKIVREWVEFARGLKPWSEGLSDAALGDHAGALLDAIVSDMETPQGPAAKAEKSKGHAPPGALTAIGLRHASDRLASGFKLDQLVAEYRALRASVVRMWAEELGDKHGELTRFNEAIDETLAEAALSYARMMNRTREQFLAILGHELRNPLGAIIAGATILTRAESIDDKQARIASRMLNSGRRMSRMVNDLLDLARTRLGGSIPIAVRETDLTPVCLQVIAELEIVHQDCKLRFEATGDLVGEWDSDRLTQVISNLVANALQHGGSLVVVVAQGEGDEVIVQVHNDGPPIRESSLKTLFEPLVRQPTQSGDGNASGLGLGLYISREIVTAHGGTLEVASSELEGTTFTVQLPRRPPSTKGAGRPALASEKEERRLDS